MNNIPHEDVLSHADLTNLTKARIAPLACTSGMQALGVADKQGRSDLPS